MLVSLSSLHSEVDQKAMFTLKLSLEHYIFTIKIIVKYFIQT